MGDMDFENIKVLKFYGKDRHITFYYTTVGFNELRKQATVDVPDAKYAKTNLIQGLYVYDEFITEGKIYKFGKLHIL